MFFDDSIKEVEEVFSWFVLIFVCCEIGIVLYIYFNMLFSIYEKKLSELERSCFLELVRKVIYYFGREDEKMGEDFRRMVLMKIVFVKFGIGVFGNYLKDVCVIEENWKKVGDILYEIGIKYWDKLEDWWKMFFYIVKFKVCELDNDLLKVYLSIVKVLIFLFKGKFVGEGVNIKYYYNWLFF